MDPEQCREQLGRLITEESSALNDLSVLLDREHGYLVANDVVSLEQAARERLPCVARIFRLDEACRCLCSQAGHPLDHQGLEHLLRWCDPQGSLARRWAECYEAAAKCRMLNDRNGALVTARLQNVQARLGTLIESRKESVTYGPRGAYAQVSAGCVLTTEA